MTLKISKPQAVTLNVGAGALLVALIVIPSWYLVVALIATLGSLAFLWTLEPDPTAKPVEDKRLDHVEAMAKQALSELGNVRFKIGMKGP